MENKNNYHEPVEFLYSKLLFSGFSTLKINKVELIDNIIKANEYAYEQLLPKGFKVWHDFLENIFPELGDYTKVDEATEIIDEYFSTVEKQRPKETDYERQERLARIKRQIKKEDSDYERFLYDSDAKEKACYALRLIAVNRYLNGFKPDSILETIFSVYKHGGWPCGIKKDNTILVFNPTILSKEPKVLK